MRREGEKEEGKNQFQSGAILAFATENYIRWCGASGSKNNGIM